MRLATLLLALTLVAGCGTADRGADELADVARELAPASSALVEVDEGSCVQLAGNPACARLYLTAAGTEQERVAELERTARAAGWEVVSTELRVDGTLVELGREGYRAFAAIWEDERAGPCHEQPDTSCADEIQVVEDV